MSWEPASIIMHHSATADSQTVSWDAIRRFHVETRGWADIGYHFGVELVGKRPEILFGRLPDRPGAHTQGHNARSLGICVVGNFDLHPPPPAIWRTAARLVAWLCRIYGIVAFREVFGHRDFAQKTCPGKYFNMLEFRKQVVLFEKDML